MSSDTEIVVKKRVYCGKFGPVNDPHVRRLLTSKFPEIRKLVGEGLFIRLIGPKYEQEGEFKEWIEKCPHLGYVEFTGCGIYIWAFTPEAVAKAKNIMRQYDASCAGGQPMAVLVD